MISNCRKFLCYMLSFALIHSSVQPAYAIPFFLDDDDFSFYSSPKRVNIVPNSQKTELAFQYMWNPIKAVVAKTSECVHYVCKHPLNSLVMGLSALAQVGNAGNEFQISQYPSGSGYPLLSAVNLMDGGIYTTWVGPQYNVNSSFLSRNGTRQSQEFQIDQLAWYGQASVVSIGPNVFEVYSSQKTGFWNVYGSLLSQNGSVLANALILKNNTGIQGNPSIASSNGSLGVVYQCDQSGDVNICGRPFFQDGTPRDNEKVLVNKTGNQMYPNLRGLSTGGYAFVYQSDQTGDVDVHLSIVSPDWIPLCDVRVNQMTPDNQVAPSICEIAKKLYIVWSGPQNGDSDIRSRIFDTNCTALSDEFVVPEDNSGY